MRPVTDLRRAEKPFEVISPYSPSGDQPTAIAELTERLRAGEKDIVLLGATGTGKSATAAWLVERVQRPTLILEPNKTLAAQMAAEFITYWGPRIEARGRVLLTFAADQIAAIARYTMTESGTGAAIVPDTFLRVYLLVGDVPASGVPEQVLAPAPPRTGFTAVEWGGSEL